MNDVHDCVWKKFHHIHITFEWASNIFYIVYVVKNVNDIYSKVNYFPAKIVIKH